MPGPTGVLLYIIFPNKIFELGKNFSDYIVGLGESCLLGEFEEALVSIDRLTDQWFEPGGMCCDFRAVTSASKPEPR